MVYSLDLRGKKEFVARLQVLILLSPRLFLKPPLSLSPLAQARPSGLLFDHCWCSGDEVVLAYADGVLLKVQRNFHLSSETEIMFAAVNAHERSRLVLQRSTFG
jgi:hypothetical protein